MNSKEKSLVAAFAVVIIAIFVAVIAVSMSVRNSGVNDYVVQEHTTPAVTSENTTKPQTSQQSTQPVTVTEITIEEAKSIALKDCGQENNTAVVFTKTKTDDKKGVKYYKLEFDDRITEYEYKINCQTGEIMSRSSEPYDKD